MHYSIPFRGVLSCLLFLALGQAASADFQIGVGKYDITGPTAERVMMGYADPRQLSAGLQTRLNSRAFVVATSPQEFSPRVAIVVADLGMIFSAVKTEVIKRLGQEFPGVYNDSNVMLSATHTHAGPGGYSHHDLYNVSTLGFDHRNFNVIVEGIVRSIREAHNNLASGDVFIASGDLLGASINRSRTAYQANPDWRQFHSETDPSNVLLRFRTSTYDIGMLNWFAVHPVSMSKHNRLISSDNSGYAAKQFENEMKVQNPTGRFVAGFANANEGDSSPNVFEEEDGSKRRLSDTDKMQAIGTLRLQKALELFSEAKTALSRRILYRHVWLDMPKHDLCLPAVGDSFAAGASDGPSGLPGYYEGMKQGPDYSRPFPVSPIVALLIKVIGGNRQGQDCHFPKPVFLSSSERNKDLIPSVLPMQLWVVGELAIIGVPAEFTTMAGRRLKTQVLGDLQSMGVTQVVLAGLSNEYSGYVATREEYNEQSYSASFTLYGPNTLNRYLEIFTRLAEAVRDDKEIAVDAPPEPRRTALFGVHDPVLFDGRKIGEKFGKVLLQPKKSYQSGEQVLVKFRGGNPNHVLEAPRSGDHPDFFLIEREEQGRWLPVVSDLDSDINALFTWSRDLSFGCIECSTVGVSWKITDRIPTGKYRIVHFGFKKHLLSTQLKKYSGVSSEFLVKE